MKKNGFYSWNLLCFSSLKTEELRNARLGLIRGVSEGLLKGLIDSLRATTPPVLNEREANELLQAHPVTQDRTGKLVDMVVNKGDHASFLMISALEQSDNHLVRQLGLLVDSIEEARLQRESNH